MSTGPYTHPVCILYTVSNVMLSCPCTILAQSNRIYVVLHSNRLLNQHGNLPRPDSTTSEAKQMSYLHTTIVVVTTYVFSQRSHIAHGPPCGRVVACGTDHALRPSNSATTASTTAAVRPTSPQATESVNKPTHQLNDVRCL